MKKNKMMRLASALLVAVLLTTSVISGTYAKYVTTASATDTARVAKWGIQFEVASDVFETSYEDGNLTVDATDEDVVAPGTTENAVVFTISGAEKPEVDFRLDVTLDANDALSMVTLPAGTYKDYTNTAEEFTVSSEGYYPVQWTLTRDGTELASGKLTDIEKYLDETLSGDYEVGTVNTLNGKYTLTWEWLFETAPGTVSLQDQADTYLGQVAAGVATVSLRETFKLNITATQID